MRQDILSPTKKISFSAYYVRYYGAINVVLTLAVIAGGAFFLLKPKYEMAKASMDISALNEDLAAAQTSLRKLDGLNQSFSEIPEEDRERIAKIIPDEKNLEKLFPLMETIVARNGLLLVSLEVAEVKEETLKTQAQIAEEGAAAEISQAAGSPEAEEKLPPEIIKIKISMEVGGTEYTGLKSLLKSLENNLSLMDVMTVDYTDGENAKLELMTYFYKKTDK